MEINYININDEMVKAIGTDCGKYPDKINAKIADELINLGYLSKKDVTIRKKLVVTVRPTGADVFNFETGKKIARDKLLIKYNAELERIYENYAFALEKYLKYIVYREGVSLSKRTNALERYLEFKK